MQTFPCGKLFLFLRESQLVQSGSSQPSEWPPPPSPLVFQTTWVKKAGMKVLWQGKDYNCTLELEQGVGSEMDGKLTIQFKLKHKHKVSSYMCVLSVDWQDKPCASKESMLTVVVKRDGWLLTCTFLTLELERGVRDEMDGTLNVQFKLKQKHKVSAYMCMCAFCGLAR